MPSQDLLRRKACLGRHPGALRGGSMNVCTGEHRVAAAGGLAATTRARDYVPFPVSTSPQRRRITPLTWLNPMSTRIPMVRITIMIEIAPAMSSWSW